MWLPSAPNLRAGQVAEVIKNSSVVVIHAWGMWNATDHLMDRVLSELAPLFSSQVSFYSMDVDEEDNGEFLRQHIRNVPTLICYKNGMQVDTVIGLRDKQVLFDLIDSLCK